MKKEIEVAVEWWASQLREVPIMDNGDFLQSAMLGFLAEPRETITEEQIEMFKESLTHQLEEQYKDHWNDPHVGSYWRAIGVDYDPDHALIQACDDAKIEWVHRFPVKTMMWVNPKQVSVKVGYGASLQVIYQEEELPNA